MIRSLLGLFRMALLDLRGELRHFWILIACIALGVGTVAMVGSVGASLQSALLRDARLLLGGDMEARLTERPASAAERAMFGSLGRVAEVVDFMARAQSEAGDSVFAAVRAAGAGYPLLGSIATLDAGNTDDQLGLRGGLRGTVVDQELLDRLGAKVGDRIGLGEARFEIRGVLLGVPDQVSQGIAIGFPMLISTDGIAETGILKPGSLARYRYKIELDQGLDFAEAAARIDAGFPNAGWRYSSPEDATEELASYFGLFRQFLTIVGLSALLVGGLGVANAVSAYVLERQGSIATFKALGATRARVLGHFLVQVMLLTLVGIALGALVGAGLTLLVLPLLGPALGLGLQPMVDWSSIATSTAFGLLVGFIFALLPLTRIREMRPALLFRAMGGAPRARSRWRRFLRPGVALPMLAALAALFGIATFDTGRADVVFWYAAGAMVAFLLLRATAYLMKRGLTRLPPSEDSVLRNAIRATCRPGSPAAAVILSLGLGVSLLLVIALTADNLRRQLDPDVRVDSPSLVYLDLFEDEVAQLQELAAADDRVSAFTAIPVLRTSSLLINGKAPPEIKEPPRDMSLYFGDEVPLTYSTAMPAGSALASGTWWPPGYAGPPLVSVSDDSRELLGLELGDVVSFDIFGEPVAATVASFRRFEWQRGGVNFPYVLSPAALDAYPVSYFGLLKAREGDEPALQSDLVAAYPDLVFLPIEEAIGAVRRLIDTVSTAVAIVGTIALASGVLVLAGALATGRRQREADAVVAKVLGATRGRLIRAFIIEYGLAGALAALLAVLLGIGGAWCFVVLVLGSSFSANPVVLALVVLTTLLLTIGAGVAITWSALSARPGSFLRST